MRGPTPLQDASHVWRVRRVALRYCALVATVAAALFACSGSATDAVAPPSGGVAASIAITPSAPPAMTLGSQLALQAAVRDPGGQVVPGATVFWSSLDSTIATVTVTGVVTGRRIGSTQIGASSGGQSAVVPVAVIPVPVASVALLPATANIVVPGSVALKAVTYDATGTVLTGRVVVWASSAAQIATVDTSGKVTGITAGSATITATSEGRTGSAQVVVTQPPPAPVATVSVSPATSNLQIGAAEPLTATPRDSAGTALTGRAITWATSAATVATVSSTGIVTALGAGTATIAAASEGKTGTATVVVPTPPPTVAVASVRVTPAATSLRTNQTRTLTAKAYDANGNELSGRTITWESSDDQAVPVSQTGPSTATVTAATRGFGAILITATCERVTGSSIVTFSN